MYTLVHEINKKISIWQNNNWNKILSNASVKDHSIWKILKQRNYVNDKNIAPILHNNTYLFKYNDKIDAIIDNYEKVSLMNKDFGTVNHNKKIVSTVRKYFKNNPIDNKSVRLTNQFEVKRMLLRSKNKKAPGSDGITYVILKKLPRSGSLYLALLNNSIMCVGYFPDNWKIACVIPIPKPGKNPSLATSYRPISLLNHLSKIVEKIIARRIDIILRDKKILIYEQFGFRTGHSAIAQLARLVNYITGEFSCKKHVGAVFLDIEKAFDTVWHSGILYKLIGYGFPPYIVRLIASYLKDRKMYVFYNSKKSKIVNVTAGVPQGSVLGPRLYNMYINDIIKVKSLKYFLFADDTAMFTSSFRIDTISKRITVAADKIIKFFMKWKIRVNENKTVAILFTRRRPSVRQNVKINGSKVEWTDVVTYLGLQLDSKLNFGMHVKNVKNKCMAILLRLYPLLCRNSKLSITNKLTLYKSVARSVMMYACPIWSNICNSNFNLIQVVQNKFLRTIGDFHRCTFIPQIHNTLKIDMVKKYAKILTKRFFSHCKKVNPVLYNELKYDTNKKYKHRRLTHILYN